MQPYSLAGSIQSRTFSHNEDGSTVRLYLKSGSLSLLVIFVGWWNGAMAREAPSFDTLIPREDHHLSAHFFEAKGEGPFPIAVLLQGLLGEEGEVLGLGKKLSEAGIHALAFNFSGVHSSGGERTMVNDQLDVGAAYDYVHRPEIVARYHIDTSLVFLGGRSHGGGVAMPYAADNPEVEPSIDGLRRSIRTRS